MRRLAGNTHAGADIQGRKHIWLQTGASGAAEAPVFTLCCKAPGCSCRCLSLTCIRRNALSLQANPEPGSQTHWLPSASSSLSGSWGGSFVRLGTSSCAAEQREECLKEGRGGQWSRQGPLEEMFPTPSLVDILGRNGSSCGNHGYAKLGTWRHLRMRRHVGPDPPFTDFFLSNGSCLSGPFAGEM